MKIGDIWFMATYYNGVQFSEYHISYISDEYVEWTHKNNRDKVGLFEKDMENSLNFRSTKTLALRGLIKQMSNKYCNMLSDAQSLKSKIQELEEINKQWSHLRVQFKSDYYTEYIDAIGSVWYYKDRNLYIQDNDSMVETVLEDVDRQEAEDWIRESSGETTSSNV